MKLRRILARLGATALALGMALVPATPALALTGAQKGSISLTNIETGASVDAYQLFTVNWDDAQNQPQEPVYVWSSDVVSLVGAIAPDYVGTGDAVSDDFKNADTDFFDKLAAAIKASSPQIAAKKHATSTGAATTDLTDLSMGGYLILTSNSTNFVYQPSVVNLTPSFADGSWSLADQQAAPKRTSLSITKTADDKAENDVSVGDTVSYTIEADVPKYMTNAPLVSKKFAISDVLSAGLTYDGASIKAYGVDGGGTETLLTGTAYTLGTTDLNNKSVTFAAIFNYESIKDYAKVKVTYDATVNSNAVVASPNGNKATLEYNNNPYDTSNVTDQTTSTTSTFTYGIEMLKVSKADQSRLAGATFSISRSSDGSGPLRFSQASGGAGSYVLDPSNSSATTTLGMSSDGSLLVQGLAQGDYYLTEIQAPAGYNRISTPVQVTIKDADSSGTLDGRVGTAGSTPESASHPGFVTVSIANGKGLELPSTGEMGTVLLTATGLLIIAAAFVGIRRSARTGRQ